MGLFLDASLWNEGPTGRTFVTHGPLRLHRPHDLAIAAAYDLRIAAISTSGLP